MTQLSSARGLLLLLLRGTRSCSKAVIFQRMIRAANPQRGTIIQNLFEIVQFPELFPNVIQIFPAQVPQVALVIQNTTVVQRGLARGQSTVTAIALMRSTSLQAQLLLCYFLSRLVALPREARIDDTKKEKHDLSNRRVKNLFTLKHLFLFQRTKLLAESSVDQVEDMTLASV